MDDFICVHEFGLASNQLLEFFELTSLDQIGAEHCMRHTTHQRAIALCLCVECVGPIDGILCLLIWIAQRLDRRLCGLPNVKW